MKRYKEVVIQEIPITELDLQHPYYDGDVRNEIEYSGEIWSEAPFISIDRLIDILQDLRTNSAEYVYISDHSDHKGYYITGIKLEEIAIVPINNIIFDCTFSVDLDGDPHIIKFEKDGEPVDGGRLFDLSGSYSDLRMMLTKCSKLPHASGVYKCTINFEEYNVTNPDGLNYKSEIIEIIKIY